MLFFTEPNHFKHFKVPLTPEAIAKSFLTLRAILDKFPKYGTFVAGPDLSAPVQHKESLDRLRRCNYLNIYIIK